MKVSAGDLVFKMCHADVIAACRAADRMYSCKAGINEYNNSSVHCVLLDQDLNMCHANIIAACSTVDRMCSCNASINENKHCRNNSSVQCVWLKGTGQPYVCF